jgi:hypothetical protein
MGAVFITRLVGARHGRVKIQEKTEGKKRSEDGGQKTEVRRRRSEDGGQRKKKVGGLKVESQRSKMKMRIHLRSRICNPSFSRSFVFIRGSNSSFSAFQFFSVSAFT